MEGKTWNGALSYSTVKNPLTEIFFKSVRGISCTDYRSIKVKKSKTQKNENVRDTQKTLEDFFDAAWEEDQLRTLKFVFYLRDCREGKGERKLFRALMRHMREKGLGKHIIVNMEHIPYFGYWKDLLVCFLGTELENLAIEMFSNCLNSDIEKLKNNESKLTLCARHAPSEGCSFDRSHKVVDKICKKLKISKRDYRKKYIVPLRKHLKVVETQMCDRLWNDIKYENVPSIAGSRYKKAFIKRDGERYRDFLLKVQKGEIKMNTSVLMPYQIVRSYLLSKSYDETLEAQWVSFLKDRRSKWPNNLNVLPIIDVSGSMFTAKNPQAVEVAISLGMVFSLLNSSQNYKGKFITFSASPEMLKIPNGSLFEQINFIKTSAWGMNTNFQKVFDLILNTATMFNLSQEQMPQILLVLSDMQFDEADNNKTNWDVIEGKYEIAGYKRPTIVFWNLNGSSNDYPIPNDRVPNCALLSGFNDSIMYSILDGNIPSPIEIVHRTLDNERYACIQLADEN
jgi:hypothetical protein